MAYTIAVAGKGGSGKTTLAALIIDYLLSSAQMPILAVDADPNSNLNEALGVSFDRTVVSTVDEIMDKKEAIPAGITKERLLDYHLQDALVESKEFDLLVMGRTEGPGCYCVPNNLLRMFMEKLKTNYRYVIMDNEAGMEHLSRRTTKDVDVLFIVANPNVVSLRSAKRIWETTQELKLGINKAFLVINNLDQNLNLFPSEAIKDTGLSLLGNLPYDEKITRRSIEAKSLLDLDGDSPAVRAVRQMMETLEIRRSKG